MPSSIHNHTILTTLLVLSAPFMLYKLLTIGTACTTPVMVVISESMAPAFHRGDIIFLWNRADRVRVGEIPVVWFKGSPLPMVHRAVRVFASWSGSDGLSQSILTKGDNNVFDDVVLYPPGRSWVHREEVVGVVKGYLPYLGYLTIAWSEVPWLKEVGMALACLVGLLS